MDDRTDELILALRELAESVRELQAAILDLTRELRRDSLVASAPSEWYGYEVGGREN